MSESSAHFSDLMQQVRQGSDTAARELLIRYGDHILRAVRRRLHQRMRSKFDSQDFVQAVWASFFADLPHASRLACPRDLIAFLARTAANKVVGEHRRRMTGLKRNINREISIENCSASSDFPLASAEPTASQVAIANEQWGRLVADQPDHYRRVLELRVSGATIEQISEEMNLHERTVRRILQKLSQQDW